jgi:hypothetical protein
VRVHAAASAGSAGQGSERARHCITPAATSMMPAVIKSAILCSDSQTICGKVVTNPAIAAPAPMETSSAGSAQQINVPPLVNSDKNETSVFCLSAGSSPVFFTTCLLAVFDFFRQRIKCFFATRNRFHDIACVGNFGFDGGIWDIFAFFQ